MANKTDFRYSLSLGGKIVPGKILIDYDNGNAEWFQQGGSKPTFSSSKDTGGSGKWGWVPSDATAISDLRGNLPPGLAYTSDDTLRKDFYTGNSIPGLNNQRAYAFNRNAPQTGRTLGVPGVRGTSGNTAPAKPSDPAPTTPAPSGTPSPDGPSSTPVSTGAQPPGGTQRPNSGLLIYPLTMDGLQDRIKFTALEYVASGNLSTGEIGNVNRTSSSVKEGRKPVGYAFLPIQASITDTNSVDWQGANLNAIEKEFANLSQALMKAESYGDVENAMKTTFTDAFTALKKYGPEIRVAFAEQAVGTQNLLARFGSVLNPNFELLFSGPQLRPFDFRFQMSAREQLEANNIKEIIKFFKKNMAPKRTDDGIFLKAPNTFLIEYKQMGGDTEHGSINKIKECALLNCSVDYTPLGTYMTYPDGTMVSYSMTLSFQELEPIYAKDYDGKHSIGY